MLKYLDPLHYNPETGYTNMPYKLMGVIVHDQEEDLSKGKYGAYALREVTKVENEDELEAKNKKRDEQLKTIFGDTKDALKQIDQLKAIQEEQNKNNEKRETVFKWYHFTEGECIEVEEEEVLRHHVNAQVFFYERVFSLHSFK